MRNLLYDAPFDQVIWPWGWDEMAAWCDENTGEPMGCWGTPERLLYRQVVDVVVTGDRL